MSLSPTVLVRLALVCAATATAVTPLAAERWLEIQSARANGIPTFVLRLDLDSLKQENGLLFYRTEITYPNDPRRAGWVIHSESLIDCAAGLRKSLSIENVLPDGSIKKNAGANLWRKIQDYEVAK